VIARTQLLELGLSAKAIKHRVSTGRLHPLWRGVYAVGRPEVTDEGLLLAAVLACGEGSAVSHDAAAVHHGIRKPPATLHISTPNNRTRPDITVHRRPVFQVTTRNGIPVTTVAQTIVDLAPGLDRNGIEALIGEADRLRLTNPPKLRKALEALPRQPGVAALKYTLDRRTFRLTQSELERWFLPIAKKAGLTLPLTQRRFGPYRVDFYWPHLELVVETDGLAYHRTAAQQSADLVRANFHFAEGRTPLRFSHEQVRYERDYVLAMLVKTSKRLGGP
jgi:very-short-patch-repair endonuclease